MIILIVGGASSGKSSYAEELLINAPEPHIYIATLHVYGEEERQRVARHKAMRAGKNFSVIERECDMAELNLNASGGSVLLECIANLVANQMYDPKDWHQRNLAEVEANVLADIDALERQCQNLIIVSNEVGSEVTQYSNETLDYINLVGRINCILASRADYVVECVSGIRIAIKGDVPAWMRCVQ